MDSNKDYSQEFVEEILGPIIHSNPPPDHWNSTQYWLGAEDANLPSRESKGMYDYPGSASTSFNNDNSEDATSEDQSSDGHWNSSHYWLRDNRCSSWDASFEEEEAWQRKATARRAYGSEFEQSSFSSLQSKSYEETPPRNRQNAEIGQENISPNRIESPCEFDKEGKRMLEYAQGSHGKKGIPSRIATSPLRSLASSTSNTPSSLPDRQILCNKVSRKLHTSPNKTPCEDKATDPIWVMSPVANSMAQMTETFTNLCVTDGEDSDIKKQRSKPNAHKRWDSDGNIVTSDVESGQNGQVADNFEGTPPTKKSGELERWLVGDTERFLGWMQGELLKRASPNPTKIGNPTLSPEDNKFLNQISNKLCELQVTERVSKLVNLQQKSAENSPDKDETNATLKAAVTQTADIQDTVILDGEFSESSLSKSIQKESPTAATELVNGKGTTSVKVHYQESVPDILPDHIELEVGEIYEGSSTHKAIQQSKPEETLSDCRQTCPGEHGLLAFQTQESLTHRYTCDICSGAQSSGSTMFGCRECDFDICSDCFNGEQDQGDQVTAPQSPKGTAPKSLLQKNHFELNTKTAPILIVFDTNTYITQGDFVPDILENLALSRPDISVLLPREVQRELDYLKTNDSQNVSFQARAAIRLLSDLSVGLEKHVRYFPIIRGQTDDELYSDEGHHKNPASLVHDDAILNCCLYFSRGITPPRRVFIVTEDRMFRFKASLNGLELADFYTSDFNTLGLK